MVRDRDYIVDNNSNILRIIGDSHPEEGLLSFVKYYPSESGTRLIGNRLFGYNTFAEKSIEILKDNPERIIYTSTIGAKMTVTPRKEIRKYYSCRKKTEEILANKESYYHHFVGKHLVDFIELSLQNMAIEKLGITGSFLFDAQNDESDIDLVCYGKKAFVSLLSVFKESDFIQPYEKGLQDVIVKRRSAHMRGLSRDAILIQESRKLQGVIRGTSIHINCQPLRDDEDIILGCSFQTLGNISCKVKILDDNEGIFAPAIYEIQVQNVCKCDVNDLFSINIVRYIISYFGDYSQVFKNGDLVDITGSLVKVEKDGQVFYAIELSNWTSMQHNMASLIL